MRKLNKNNIKTICLYVIPLPERKEKFTSSIQLKVPELVSFCFESWVTLYVLSDKISIKSCI
jgi:hypothetical protein